MNDLETPIRYIFDDLTHETNEAELDPFEAYVRLCEEMGKRGLHADAYGSSSITSGGHARNNDLAMGDVIARNTGTALAMCNALYASKQLNPNSTIEAVTLGKIKPWTQSNYMEFWLATMAGLKWTGHGVAHEIETFQGRFTQLRSENEQLDMAAYNSSALPASERAPHYFEHARTFSDALSGFDTQPVEKIVQLVDPDTSLGSQTEKVFAKLIGAQVFRVALAKTGISPTADFIPSDLVTDSRDIVAFGGTLFDTTERKIAVLVADEAESIK